MVGKKLGYRRLYMLSGITILLIDAFYVWPRAGVFESDGRPLIIAVSCASRLPIYRHGCAFNQLNHADSATLFWVSYALGPMASRAMCTHDL